MSLRDTRLLRRLAANGAIGLADGYVEGEFEADDLAALIELGALHLEPTHRPALSEPVIRASQAAWRALSRAGRARGPLHDIVAHYDLGNDFYAAWLDPTMTYSAAVFTHPDMTLEEAQREKYRRLAAAADVRAGHRVLEIGSGWGGFALHAAGELGALVTTVTVSREQAGYVEKLAADRGLADRIEVRLEDLTATRGSNDRVISIEMIESIPKRRWPAFFETVRARLVPGGLAGLQIITVADRHWASSDANPDFIRRYVFPGGQVPSPRVLRALEADHGLERRSEETHGGSYARTLRAWRDAFDSRWDDIRSMGFDDRFRRMWRYYLAYCEGGFRAGRVDVVQLAPPPALNPARFEVSHHCATGVASRGMEGRRVSIRDVAKEAGVSVTTVSHALNDKGRLNPATRERVRAIARQLGYRPNPAARSLVSGRTGLIAVVASLPSGVHAELGDFGYFADLIGAATGVAVARDVALVVAPSEDDPFVWDRVSLDGVVVAGPMAGDAAVAALRERRIPFVTIGRDPEGGDGDAVVDTDEDASTRAMLDHLVQAGARRVGTIGLPPTFSSTRTRVEVYERWCEERHVPPAVTIVGFDDLLRDRFGTVAEAVRRLVDDADPVDAIYAPVEQIGMATLQVLRDRGTEVPDDVMLATTNDAGRADTASPPVTTLDTDHRLMGRRATELLLDLIDGIRAAPCLELVPSSISARRSTRR